MIDAPMAVALAAVLYAIYLSGEFGSALFGFVKGILTKKASNRNGNSYGDKVIHNDMGEVGGEE
jgi:hypothetical protein